MFLENVKDLYKKYDDTEAYQRARAALISAISILEEMITYFNNLIILLEYITDGLLYEKDIYPDAFANHKKYREMKRESTMKRR